MNTVTFVTFVSKRRFNLNRRTTLGDRSDTRS